jgi:hypothetical protein
MEKMVNRVLQVWKSWEDKQREIDKVIGNGKEHNDIICQLKLNHFQKCNNLLKENIRKDEQAFLPMMVSVISKLERQVYPNKLVRLILRLKNFIVDAPKQVKLHAFRRQENMEALKTQLVKAGFSDFAGKLEDKLDPFHQTYEIKLSSQLDRDRSMNVNLHFEKDSEDRFHFSTAEALIKHPDNNTPDRSFRFKMEEWPGLKAVEVKNLLEGRAIKQDFTDVSGKPNSQWLELSPDGGSIKRYPESFGYDLKETLNQPQFDPIVYRQNKSIILSKLESGHQVAVRWSYAGGSETIHLKADPANGTVELTDNTNTEIDPTALNKKMESNKEKQQAVVKQLVQTPKASQGKKRNRSVGA